ncbi:type II toxin-antitoxin system VapB family antitoxin [Gracilimonas sp.]|uniref:type II toxin-antitoxin system VapB family antitoxin n=1 Tax=Gracilimonas sp. TaxID=1974203 RepID=UPI00375015E3
MRTTLYIPEKLINEAMKVTGAKTKVRSSKMFCKSKSIVQNVKNSLRLKEL